MNVTLWELFVFEEEEMKDGVAEIQYHLASSNHWTGVPTNSMDKLVKSTDGRQVYLPMIVKEKEIKLRFYDVDITKVENQDVQDFWVIQTQSDILNVTPEEISTEALSIWNSSNLSAEYNARPHSAKSVKSWLSTLDVGSEYVPSVWITPSEVINARGASSANTKNLIIRASRGHEDCAAVMVAVAKKETTS